MLGGRRCVARSRRRRWMTWCCPTLCRSCRTWWYWAHRSPTATTAACWSDCSPRWGRVTCCSTRPPSAHCTSAASSGATSSGTAQVRPHLVLLRSDLICHCSGQTSSGTAQVRPHLVLLRSDLIWYCSAPSEKSPIGSYRIFAVLPS